MDARLAGSGPAADAVESALSDAGTEARPVRVDAADVGGADLAVACGESGGPVLETAGDSARSSATPLVAVEAGGVGGHRVAGVSAAVAGFAPGAGCYDCLSTRVAATDPDTDSPDDGLETRSAARFAGAIAGREAVKLLAGRPSGLLPALEDGTQLSGVIEVPHARRTLLPVPGCACDPGEAPTFDRSYREVSLEVALERAELAVDERLGIVERVGEAESFPAPYYLAHVCDTTGFSDASAPGQAAGVDHDWNRAFVKALGEGLERYSAGVYRSADFRDAPPEAVEDGVSPSAFVRPPDASDVDPEDPIAWVPGVDLSDDGDCWLPAEVVHFPPPAERYVPAITTGLGLGNSPVEAALSGLYEVIERDATMIAWYSTFEPLELAVDDDGFQTLARRARSEDLSVTPLLVTVDVDVPVVAVAVHREGEWPRFAVGSAADLDAAAAARSALAEAVQNWMELRSMGPEEARDESTAIGRYADFPEAAREFLEADGPIRPSDVGEDQGGEAELAQVVEALEAVGLTPYVAPVTPQDVNRIGFDAVRVVVPGAQPLFTDRPAFGERARSVPGELGFEADLEREHHPYP
jgi:ribosomal protein S12 methylthiotransferase accessory factor